jgi:glycosyltransferase involved in cell wall biosynthesis
MKNEHFPLVSLLIANYNNGAFIVETLNSAVSQTYPNIEIIVVDDASTDQSVVTVERYMQDHTQAKIELYKNDMTYGCGRNKRRCIEIAKGDFFAFLDPEDTIDPTAVEKLMSIHLQDISKYSIVYSTHYLCNEKLEVQSVSGWPGKIPDGQSHLTSTGGHISAFAVCSKSFYNRTSGINPEYIVAEDMDLYLKMEEVAPVFFIDKPLYYYRKHDHNLSWDYDKRYQNLYWRHKAEIAAYKRRKEHKTMAYNLTIYQLHKKKFTFNMQYAKSYRIKKQYFKSIIYNIKAVPYLYTFLLNIN